jgi:hypothetical protein
MANPSPVSGWRSTYAFRQFRQKHGTLSKLYWTSQLGVEALRFRLSAAPGQEFAIDQLGSTVPRGLIPEDVATFLDNLDARQGIQRLHALVICAANLETYLKDAALLHLGSQGHAKAPYVLNKVGAATGQPILKSSTVPDMLAYAEELLPWDPIASCGDGRTNFDAWRHTTAGSLPHV